MIQHLCLELELWKKDPGWLRDLIRTAEPLVLAVLKSQCLTEPLRGPRNLLLTGEAIHATPDCRLPKSTPRLCNDSMVVNSSVDLH